jgi:hypothetical protein
VGLEAQKSGLASATTGAELDQSIAQKMWELD